MPALRQYLKRPEPYLLAVGLILTALVIDALRPPQAQQLARAYDWAVAKYQLLGRPWLAEDVRCRYRPSCSEYSREAVQRHGILRGLALSVARVRSCTRAVPFGTPDPVPGMATGAPAPRPPEGRSASAPRRRALIVGINDYTSGLPVASREQVRWRNLRGAVNDAEAMRDLLIGQYDFPAAGVLLLTDRAATRQAIREGLEQHLLASAKRGDELVFFYAGHGSQVPNRASEEDDKLDESLVPADSNLGADDLRDKELARLFNQILDTGAKLTVLFDSCHSGSIARGIPASATPRFLPASTRGVVDSAPTGGKPEERGALILSAAQDFERAYEISDPAKQIHGAFSQALLSALGRGLPGEGAEVTFQRAWALLQGSETQQRPVLAGTLERQRRPLFGHEQASARSVGMIAVQKTSADGTVILEGGWIHGLREGVELDLQSSSPHEELVRLRVVRVLGPVSAEARVVATRSVRRSPQPVAAGELVAISRWVIANEPTLKVWVPEAGPSWSQQMAWIRQLCDLSEKSGVRWVTDPTESTPTHVLYRKQDGWWLTHPAGVPESLGATPASKDILRRLQAGTKEPILFVNVPSSSDLARHLDLGQGSQHDAVERVSDPADAHYLLVGRLVAGQMSFAWLRPEASATDPELVALPLRSNWCDEKNENCAETLTESALRIAKIRAWLTLESPLGSEFPYRFALRGESGQIHRDGELYAGQKLGLVLQSDAQALAYARAPRYLYFFSIDSFGNSVLLFPRGALGSVENRFPIVTAPSGRWPNEIQVGARDIFRIREPFGTDTYFLLSTEEPIPNPWVVQFPGVRSRGPRGTTLLEELLSQTGSSSRGVEPLDLPVTWSLERLTFKTLPKAAE